MNPEDIAYEAKYKREHRGMEWYLCGKQDSDGFRVYHQLPGMPPPIAFAGEDGIWDLDGPYLIRANMGGGS